MIRTINLFQLRATLEYHSEIKEANQERPAVQNFRIANEEIKIGMFTFNLSPFRFPE